jgi:pyruvate kinase
MRRLASRVLVSSRGVNAPSRGLSLEPPLIQHSADLIIDPTPTPAAVLHRYGRPKVIATIGPASSSADVIDGMIHAGMDLARFNLSHGSHADHHRGMQLLRQRALQFGEHIGVALDTKGPEVRLGRFQPSTAAQTSTSAKDSNGSTDTKKGIDESRTYRHGDTVIVTIDPEHKDAMSKERLFIDYGELLLGPRRPTHFLISDGNLELMVEDVNLQKGECKCFVTRGATVFDRSNVHIVGAEVNLPLVSERDEADLTFGVANDVDFIFASFVRSPQQIHELRGILGTRGRRIAIVAKIETVAAIANLSAIIDASDGVMVARGDLGVALPIERSFFAQKKIIAACNIAGKPVIVATQMLESMTRHKRPTRAETTDVANAVIDGADALMLSAESARGEHPEAAVRMLSRISAEATGYVRHKKRFTDIMATMNRDDPGELGGDNTSSVSFRKTMTSEPAAMSYPRTAASAAAQAEQQRDSNLVRATLPRTIGYIAEAAVLTSLECQARCIITATVSGNSVRKLRQCCPRCPIVAACKTESVARQLSLVRGVTACTLRTWSTRISTGLWTRSSRSSASGATRRTPTRSRRTRASAYRRATWLS